MTVSRGDVRWGPALHKPSPAYRPWLVVSTERHPFAVEECIGVALTTTAHHEGLEVPESAWLTGGSARQPDASPWYVATIKTRSFDRLQGALRESSVSRVVAALHGYVPVRN